MPRLEAPTFGSASAVKIRVCTILSRLKWLRNNNLRFYPVIGKIQECKAVVGVVGNDAAGV